MAYSQTINLVTGDTLPALTFTLRDSNHAAPGRALDPSDETTWGAIEITGASIKLRIRKVDTLEVIAELTGAVADGANGKAVVGFDASTFPAAGVYEGELEITYDTGGIQTVNDLIRFKVRQSFD